MTHIAKRGAFCASALLAALLCANPGVAGNVSITDAWLRGMPANLPVGGYFTLHNGTGGNLTLIGANSPACGVLMLHKSEEMSGMSSMSDVPRIDVPPGGTLNFSPGSYHMMCMDPTPLLKQAETVRKHAVVPVTLYFADGSRIGVPFQVRSATGK
jgi:copper(I)-binding protein